MKNRLPTHPAAVLAMAFLATIGLGTLLLMLPWSTASGQSAPWMTALFTATSAVCVTGLAVVDTGTYWSPLGQGLLMALIQLGGFGMMTSAALMGLLIGRRFGLRTRLLLQSETHALSMGDVRSVVRMVLVVTLLCEVTVALWLALRFGATMDLSWSQALWQGAFHSVSAFNNAGFSTWPDSVMRHVTDAWVLGPLMLAIVVGGLGFPVLTELWVNRRNRHARWSVHTTLTLWGSAALVILGTVSLWLVERDNARTLGPMGMADQWLAALFTSVSARTAGFNALDIGALQTESLVLHYVLMFIGGGSAGTAGGVKVTTFFLLLLIVWTEIRGRADVEFRGRRIGTPVQRQALTILVLSGLALSIGLIAIVPMTDNIPLEKLMFEVVSAFATVGLSTGITADLPPGAQGVLIVLMYVGRVGVVTLALALAINQVPRAYRFPEEKPIVG
ncbi:TrkH family potassium uptake protein [uncultured Hydrogenophaga sp.]|uniref:TrkH family potassium uptake protein n=1 Tax=uncultured Hydrogenophaga sp. TaxID=199683 RepID=UPI00265F7D55|nr:TrkH family potassium uptake protein [uncultured Hydrogenophaga sp.]